MTIAPAQPQEETPVRANLHFLWLEITGKCQLSCLHCYAESGPAGSHGVMTRADWMRVIEEAADLGVGMVQFIGGEPTQHPDFISLARYALQLGVRVEVFSNLVGVTDEMWELFKTHGVQLATSYYSDDPAEHGRITAGANSHRLTTANIARAVQLFIPLRVGIIGVEDGQRTDEAWRLLESMGVTDIGYDRLRQVGRGIRDQQASAEQLCGNCANGVMAISPTGEVWPCVFSRWLPIGNVREATLAGILDSAQVAETRASLLTAFEERQEQVAGMCKPNEPCNPCTPNCGPSWEGWQGGRNVRNATCNPCVPSSCEPHCVPHLDPDGKRQRVLVGAGTQRASCKPGPIDCGPSDPCRPGERCSPNLSTCGPDNRGVS